MIEQEVNPVVYAGCEILTYCSLGLTTRVGRHGQLNFGCRDASNLRWRGGLEYAPDTAGSLHRATGRDHSNLGAITREQTPSPKE